MTRIIKSTDQTELWVDTPGYSREGFVHVRVEKGYYGTFPVDELRDALRAVDKLEAQRAEDSARMARAGEDAMRQRLETLEETVSRLHALDDEWQEKLDSGYHDEHEVNLINQFRRALMRPLRLPTEPGSVIYAEEIEMDGEDPVHGALVLDSHGRWHGVTSSHDSKQFVPHERVDPARIKAWRAVEV